MKLLEIKPRIIKESHLKFTKNHKLDEAIIYNNKAFINKANSYKSDLTKRTTFPERVFKNILDEYKILYELQHVIYIHNNYVINGFYIADFFIPKFNLIIELDGEYHYTPQQKYKDSVRDTLIQNRDYYILRIDNEEVYNKQTVLKKIINYIESNNLHKLYGKK